MTAISQDWGLRSPPDRGLLLKLSEAGHDQLDEWMEVVARERDGLDRVVHRFLRWRDRSSETEVDAG